MFDNTRRRTSNIPLCRVPVATASSPYPPTQSTALFPPFPVPHTTDANHTARATTMTTMAPRQRRQRQRRPRQWTLAERAASSPSTGVQPLTPPCARKPNVLNQSESPVSSRRGRARERTRAQQRRRARRAPYPPAPQPHPSPRTPHEWHQEPRARASSRTGVCARIRAVQPRARGDRARPEEAIGANPLSRDRRPNRCVSSPSLPLCACVSSDSGMPHTPKLSAPDGSAAPILTRVSLAGERRSQGEARARTSSLRLRRPFVSSPPRETPS